jgi:hypothetical protein
MLRRRIARNAEHAAEHALRIAGLRCEVRDERDGSRLSEDGSKRARDEREEARRSVEDAERHIRAIRQRMNARRGRPMPEGPLVVKHC